VKRIRNEKADSLSRSQISEATLFFEIDVDGDSKHRNENCDERQGSRQRIFAIRFEIANFAVNGSEFVVDFLFQIRGIVIDFFFEATDFRFDPLFQVFLGFVVQLL
jgi:hypothetical protein